MVLMGLLFSRIICLLFFFVFGRKCCIIIGFLLCWVLIFIRELKFRLLGLRNKIFFLVLFFKGFNIVVLCFFKNWWIRFLFKLIIVGGIIVVNCRVYIFLLVFCSFWGELIIMVLVGVSNFKMKVV